MKLSEFVKCPIKVQRCAGRVVQKELIVQVDHRDVVPGDILIFEPGDLFPGDIRLLSSKQLVVRYVISIGKSVCLVNDSGHLYSTFCHLRLQNNKWYFSYLVNSQASLTGESWTIDKTADVIEDYTTPLLDLKNICFMVSELVTHPCLYFASMQVIASVYRIKFGGT